MSVSPVNPDYNVNSLGIPDNYIVDSQRASYGSETVDMQSRRIEDLNNESLSAHRKRLVQASKLRGVRQGETMQYNLRAEAQNNANTGAAARATAGVASFAAGEVLWGAAAATMTRLGVGAAVTAGAGGIAAGFAIPAIAAAPLTAWMSKGIDKEIERRQNVVNTTSDVNAYRNYIGLNDNSNFNIRRLGESVAARTSANGFFDGEEISRIHKLGISNGLLSAKKTGSANSGTISQYMKNVDDLTSATEEAVKFMNTTLEKSMSVIKELKDSGLHSIEQVRSTIRSASVNAKASGLSAMDMVGFNQLGMGMSGQYSKFMMGSTAQGNATNLSLLSSRSGQVADLVKSIGGLSEGVKKMTAAQSNAVSSGMGSRVVASFLKADGSIDESALKLLKEGKMSVADVSDRANTLGAKMRSDRAMFEMNKRKAVDDVGIDNIWEIQFKLFEKSRPGVSYKAKADAFSKMYESDPLTQELLYATLTGKKNNISRIQADANVGYSESIEKMKSAYGLRPATSMFDEIRNELSRGIRVASVGFTGSSIGFGASFMSGMDNFSRGARAFGNAITGGIFEKTVYLSPEEIAKRRYGDGTNLVTDDQIRSYLKYKGDFKSNSSMNMAAAGQLTLTLSKDWRSSNFYKALPANLKEKYKPSGAFDIETAGQHMRALADNEGYSAKGDWKGLFRAMSKSDNASTSAFGGFLELMDSMEGGHGQKYQYSKKGGYIYKNGKKLGKENDTINEVDSTSGKTRSKKLIELYNNEVAGVGQFQRRTFDSLTKNGEDTFDNRVKAFIEYSKIVSKTLGTKYDANLFNMYVLHNQGAGNTKALELSNAYLAGTTIYSRSAAGVKTLKNMLAQFQNNKENKSAYDRLVGKKEYNEADSKEILKMFTDLVKSKIPAGYVFTPTGKNMGPEVLEDIIKMNSLEFNSFYSKQDEKTKGVVSSLVFGNMVNNKKVAARFSQDPRKMLESYLAVVGSQPTKDGTYTSQSWNHLARLYGTTANELKGKGVSFEMLASTGTSSFERNTAASASFDKVKLEVSGKESEKLATLGYKSVDGVVTVDKKLIGGLSKAGVSEEFIEGAYGKGVSALTKMKQYSDIFSSGAYSSLGDGVTKASLETEYENSLFKGRNWKDKAKEAMTVVASQYGESVSGISDFMKKFQGNEQAQISVIANLNSRGVGEADVKTLFSEENKKLTIDNADKLDAAAVRESITQRLVSLEKRKAEGNWGQASNLMKKLSSMSETDAINEFTKGGNKSLANSYLKAEGYDSIKDAENRGVTIKSKMDIARIMAGSIEGSPTRSADKEDAIRRSLRLVERGRYGDVADAMSKNFDEKWSHTGDGKFNVGNDNVKDIKGLLERMLDDTVRANSANSTSQQPQDKANATHPAITSYWNNSYGLQ